MSGKLFTGDKLPSESLLCEQFSASRTVVREAIQQLKARGIVETLNGKGSYITEVDLQGLEESLSLYSSRAGSMQDWLNLIALRSLIEIESVRELALKRDSRKTEVVRKTLEKMQQSSNDLKTFAEADINFHEAIVKSSSNKLFIAVWSSLKTISLRFALETYQSLGQVQKNLQEHQYIYDSLVKCNPDSAGDAMKLHLEHSRQNLKKT